MSLQFYVDKAGNRAFVQAKKVFETDALSQSVFLFSGTAYTLTASVGSLTLTAESSTFARTRILTAAVGTLSLSAQSATLVHARSMVAAVGALTLSGQSATLVKALHLTAAKTNLTLTAESATLNKALGLTAASTSLTLTAESATLKRGFAFSVSPSTLVLAAQSASLVVGTGTTAYSLTASVGFLTMTAQGAILIYQAAPPPAVQSSRINMGGPGASGTWRGESYRPEKDPEPFPMSGKRQKLGFKPRPMTGFGPKKGRGPFRPLS